MYNDDMSVKYQITLPEPLAEEMRATAARLKVPLAQFIRETMEDKLRELKSRKRKERPLAVDGETPGGHQGHRSRRRGLTKFCTSDGHSSIPVTSSHSKSRDDQWFHKAEAARSL